MNTTILYRGLCLGFSSALLLACNSNYSPIDDVQSTSDICDKKDALTWRDLSLAELTYSCIPGGWENFFNNAAVRDQVELISRTLESELAKPNSSISPKIGSTFRALYEVPADDAKAVIMGQDPAPQPGLATGLSFSLPAGTPTSAVASVQRVYLEAQNEQYCNNLENADASHWAEEGVLLLNMALTIPCDGKGVCYEGIAKHVPLWEEFTRLLMEYIDKRDQPMAFILWGSKARAFADTIHNSTHKAFEGGHPSPKADSSKFFCKSYFTCSNEWLSSKGGEPINWNLTNNSCDAPQPCIYSWNSETRTSSCEKACIEKVCG